MTTTINLTEAKSKFSDVVERVTQGEEIIVTKMGKPVVKMTRFESDMAHQRLGLFSEQIQISNDFDEWPDDFAKELGIID